MELMQSDYIDVFNRVAWCLHRKWPFFFDEPNIEYVPSDTRLIDDNPLTNRDNLSKEEMFKHMTLTCKLIGDRSMSHQLVRHRLASYSQESQRYCNYGKKGFQFIVPPNISHDARHVFMDKAVEEYENYLKMLDLKLPPEDARGLLPNCTKTEVVATYTLGMWEHIFEHRARNPKAQWQIKNIMLGVEHKFRQLLPQVFV
jgi:thymidylate synthase (FAD)